MADQILNYLLHLIQNIHVGIPIVVWLLATWRVARLRGLNQENFQERVDESVAETLKEQISTKLLDPLFMQQRIPLPPQRSTYDLVERMVEHDPNNVMVLAEIYNNLENFGITSPYYSEAVNIAFSLF